MHAVCIDTEKYIIISVNSKKVNFNVFTTYFKKQGTINIKAPFVYLLTTHPFLQGTSETVQVVFQSRKRRILQ